MRVTTLLLILALTPAVSFAQSAPSREIEDVRGNARAPGVESNVAALLLTAAVSAQSQSAADYTIGPHDVLTVQAFDQPDLGGKSAVEA
jgi:protein involved in polysaccharide export with SLBB domain